MAPRLIMQPDSATTMPMFLTDGSGNIQGGGTSVAVTPTITAGAYTAGFVIGGIMTFANVFPTSPIQAPDPTVYNAILQSITIVFKGSVQTGEFDLVLFNTNPTNGTYTDHAAPTYSASDGPFLIGTYPVTAVNSSLGTMSVYDLDGIARQINGLTNNLYGVLISKAATANNPASTTDMVVTLGMVW